MEEMSEVMLIVLEKERKTDPAVMLMEKLTRAGWLRSTLKPDAAIAPVLDTGLDGTPVMLAARPCEAYRWQLETLVQRVGSFLRLFRSIADSITTMPLPLLLLVDPDTTLNATPLLGPLCSQSVAALSVVVLIGWLKDTRICPLSMLMAKDVMTGTVVEGTSVRRGSVVANALFGRVAVSNGKPASKLAVVSPGYWAMDRSIIW